MGWWRGSVGVFSWGIIANESKVPVLKKSCVMCMPMRNLFEVEVSM